jgi:hypothetical protein
VSVVCCQVEVSATSWSLVQRSPTECGASLCVICKPQEWGGHDPRWVAAPQQKKNVSLIRGLQEIAQWLFHDLYSSALSTAWLNKNCEIGGACGTYGRLKRCIYGFGTET